MKKKLLIILILFYFSVNAHATRVKPILLIKKQIVPDTFPFTKIVGDTITATETNNKLNNKADTPHLHTIADIVDIYDSVYITNGLKVQGLIESDTSSNGSGIILQSPNGSRWIIKVDNDGILSTEMIP